MTNKEIVKRSVFYVSIMLVILIINYLTLDHRIYETEEYINQYLSTYTNIHSSILNGKLSMWSWDIFLGNNLLGTQTYFSMYNPFFLITLLFSTESLSSLYLPLLVLKLVCAFFSFYLYFRQTKWFSNQTLMISSLLYLFNGWMLCNLTEFVTIELLVFMPFLLYGVERLLKDNRKRYFVLTLSMMLISHFSVTICVMPLVILYFLLRVKKAQFKSRGLKFVSGLIVTLCLTAIASLPMILALNEISISFLGHFDFKTLTTFIFENLFPPISQWVDVDFTLFNVDTIGISVYQSLLVILLIPQLFVIASKRLKIVVGCTYGVLLCLMVSNPAIIFSSGSVQTMITSQQLSCIIILFNTVIVAYVLTHLKQVNVKLLKITTYGYLTTIMLTILLIFVYELQLSGSIIDFKLFRHELLNVTPLLFVFVILWLVLKMYYVLIRAMVKHDSVLKHKILILVVLFECVVVMMQYVSFSKQDVTEQLYSDEYLVNQTHAVTDYIRTIDDNTYRFINGYQTQSNDTLKNRYPGFTISRDHMGELMNVPWAVTTQDNQVNVESNNYYVTTALSAKYYLTPGFEISIPGYKYFDRIENITVYENEYFVPMASIQETYVLEEDFNKMTDEQKQYIFLNSLVLSRSQVQELEGHVTLVPYDLKNLPSVPKELDYFEIAKKRQSLGVQTVQSDMNYLKFNVLVSEPTLLSLNVPYDKGWQAVSNGSVVNIHEVNGGMMALELTEIGTSDIELTYTSPGYDLGFSISALTCLIIMGVFIRYYQQEKLLKQS